MNERHCISPANPLLNESLVEDPMMRWRLLHVPRGVSILSGANGTASVSTRNSPSFATLATPLCEFPNLKKRPTDRDPCRQLYYHALVVSVG